MKEKAAEAGSCGIHIHALNIGAGFHPANTTIRSYHLQALRLAHAYNAEVVTLGCGGIQEGTDTIEGLKKIASYLNELSLIAWNEYGIRLSVEAPHRCTVSEKLEQIKTYWAYMPERLLCTMDVAHITFTGAPVEEVMQIVGNRLAHVHLRLAAHALTFGETLIGNRVFDVDRAIDFIYTNKNLRKDQIGIVGNSGGGTTAIYSGAILKRLTHVMPSSCFSSYKDSILAIRHCTCNYFPGMLNWGDMGDLAGLCAPKYLVIVNGKTDPIFPVGPAEEEFKRAQAIYKAAGFPERCRMVIGNGGHRFYKADAWPVMDSFLQKQP